MSGVFGATLVPWRDVLADDLIVDVERDRLWLVVDWQPTVNAWGAITVRPLGRTDCTQRTIANGDDQVNVLRPIVQIAREQLGAR